MHMNLLDDDLRRLFRYVLLDDDGRGRLRLAYDDRLMPLGIVHLLVYLVVAIVSVVAVVTVVVVVVEKRQVDDVIHCFARFVARLRWLLLFFRLVRQPAHEYGLAGLGVDALLHLDQVVRLGVRIDRERHVGQLAFHQTHVVAPNGHHVGLGGRNVIGCARLARRLLASVAVDQLAEEVTRRHGLVLRARGRRWRRLARHHRFVDEWRLRGLEQLPAVDWRVLGGVEVAAVVVVVAGVVVVVVALDHNAVVGLVLELTLHAEDDRYVVVLLVELDGAERSARAERLLAALHELHGRGLQADDEHVALDDLSLRVRVDRLQHGNVQRRILHILLGVGHIAVQRDELRRGETVVWRVCCCCCCCCCSFDETQSAAVHEALDRVEEEAADRLQIGRRRVLHLQAARIYAQPRLDAFGVVGAVDRIAGGDCGLQLAQLEYLVGGVLLLLLLFVHAFVQTSAQVERSASDQRLLVVVGQIAHYSSSHLLLLFC